LLLNIFEKHCFSQERIRALYPTCFRRDKMKRNSMDRLIGKYCKIVTKEPGEERTYVAIGIVKDIDHDAGFITIESTQGLGCLSIKAIVAIKPKAKR